LKYSQLVYDGATGFSRLNALRLKIRSANGCNWDCAMPARNVQQFLQLGRRFWAGYSEKPFTFGKYGRGARRVQRLAKACRHSLFLGIYWMSYS
jgi:hypothetical protein